jgi:surface antigen
LGRVQAALAFGTVGTTAMVTIVLMFIFARPVDANIGFARNTGLSCSECHSNSSDPGAGALTALGAAYRACLYNPAPNQTDCNVEAQNQHQTGAISNPAFAAPVNSAYNASQPDTNPPISDPAAGDKSFQNANDTTYPSSPAFAQSSAEPPQIPHEKAGVDASPGHSGEAALDQAYRPPLKAEPPLPALPPTPVLLQRDYPDCRENHQQLPDPLDKAKDINRCTSLLDAYYENVLKDYRRRMNHYQDEISKIFTENVAGRMEYSATTRKNFFNKIRQEHAASDQDGKHMAVYRGAVQLYQLDRDYLSDRYCYNTGCGGYPVPYNYGFMNIPGKEGRAVDLAGSSAKSKDKSCKKSRGRGQLLGGIFAGIVGAAAGLDGTETLLAAAAGAVLIGEIACKLSEDEQKKASEATFAVVAQERVGAVSTWQSPTRGGVTGSSTVTALNTQPTGRKCLSITDVIIIDGEETRVSKQMCRGDGQSQYAIMA